MTTSALKSDHNIIIRKRAESVKPFWYEEVAGRWIKIKVCYYYIIYGKSLLLLKCGKCIQCFLSKNIYIFIFNEKKYFCYLKILSFKENIFIFNQNIFAFKKFYFHPGLLYIKNICLFNQKLMGSMKFFDSMIYGSQIWSSIC